MQLAGVDVEGSPATLPVVGAGRKMDPTKTTAVGDGLTGGGAGVALTYIITAKDVLGIQLTSLDEVPDPSAFLVEITGPGGLSTVTQAAVTAGIRIEFELDTCHVENECCFGFLLGKYASL